LWAEEIIERGRIGNKLRVGRAFGVLIGKNEEDSKKVLNDVRGENRR
jgi:hypothetical protein